jgi:flagellar motor switch protein FliG
MLVGALDNDKASRVLEQMSEEALQALREAADSLNPGGISRREKLKTLAAFLRDQQGPNLLGRTSSSRFRETLDRALDQRAASGAPEAQVESGTPSQAAEPKDDGRPDSTQRIEESIREASTNDVAELLNQESVRCAAVLLGALPGQMAGELLNLLEPEKCERIAERLLTMGQVPDAITEEVTKSFQERLHESKFGGGSTSEKERLDRLANMVSGLESDSQKRILERMQERDPETAEEIERRIFAFEDLVHVEKRSLQNLLGQIDSSTIALAIKGATQEVEDAITSNLSQRVLQQVNEERELAGSIPVSEAMEARDEIMKVAREMDREDALDFASGKQEEEFVE